MDINVSDAVATPHSASSNEDGEEPKAHEKRVCEAFSSPSGNVVFKSSDDVLFRVEDFYLKANSGLFRDMLSDSVSSSSMDNPLPLDEDSVDLEVMFAIITGHAHDVMDRAKDWKHAERLYRLVGKYQLENHRPWFSQICREHAAEEPWQALFLACNTYPMDYDLIKSAILGFGIKSRDVIWSDLYFRKQNTGPNGTASWSIMQPGNVTILLGQKLGFRGLLAYNLTFDGITNAAPGGTAESSNFWMTRADLFIANAKAIEKANRSP